MNDPSKMKKEIIEHFIKPFFINNGFIIKDKEYYKNLKYFQLIADVEKIEYDFEERTENFCINIKIYPPENCNENLNRIISLGGYTIPKYYYHFSINEETNINDIKIFIENELNDIKKFIIENTEYNNIEKIIRIQDKEIVELGNTIEKCKNRLEKVKNDQKSLIKELNNIIENSEMKINAIKEWIKMVV